MHLGLARFQAFRSSVLHSSAPNTIHNVRSISCYASGGTVKLPPREHGFQTQINSALEI